jgi:mono/diheme cytochrome c family protein
MITETDIDDPEDRMQPLPNEALSSEQLQAIQTWILQNAQNNSCESSGCDTLNITYSGTIRPLIENRCEGCHSGGDPSGELSYENYDGVAQVAADGRLLGAINWDPDYTNMPQNGDQLSQCNIDKIRIWIENGYPND